MTKTRPPAFDLFRMYLANIFGQILFSETIICFVGTVANINQTSCFISPTNWVLKTYFPFEKKKKISTISDPVSSKTITASSTVIRVYGQDEL